MSELKYQTYSSKPSILATGTQYGVNEMVETGTSMGLQEGRKIVVSGITSGIENDFVKDMIQDGLGAGIGYFSGQIMQKQEKLLESSFNATRVLVGAWYSKSFIRDKFKSSFKKGRKASMFSKFLGSTDNKAEECRIINDFGKMDIDTSANANNPLTRQNVMQNKFQHDSLQVNKEGVNSSLAKLQIDGMRDTFEMKVKTSSFVADDKNLIRKMTGKTMVDSKDIDKLNSLSSSMVFQDSNGKWVGGNEAIVTLMNGLGIHRAN